MSAGYHSELMSQAAKAFNARDWEAYGAAFAEAVVVHAPGFQEPMVGRASRLEWVQAILGAFPDARVEMVRSFGDGNLLCAELVFTGTHAGPLPRDDGEPIPATDIAVRFPYCMALEFKDGEIVEVHEYFDFMGLLKQLDFVV